MAVKIATTTVPENPHDKYEVKILKDNEVVGHIQRDLSKYYTSILLRGRNMECVIGTWQNKRGNGLEVLYKYIVKGPTYMLTIIKCMIKDYLVRTNR